MEITTTADDIEDTTAEMNDTQAFIANLASMCETKKKEWAERSKMRAEEVQAHSILRLSVVSKTGLNGSRISESRNGETPEGLDSRAYLGTKEDVIHGSFSKLLVQNSNHDSDCADRSLRSARPSRFSTMMMRPHSVQLRVREGR